MFRSLGILFFALAFGCGSNEPATSTVADSESEAVAPERQAAGEVAKQRRANTIRHGVPIIESVSLIPDEPVAGEIVRVLVSLQDDDAAEVGYVWSLAGRALRTGEAEVILPETARRGDTLQVEVRAVNDRGTSDAEIASTEIGNRPPEWRALSLSHEGEIQRGTVVEARPVVVDPDLDVLEYEVAWTVNDELVASGFQFDTRELRRGDRIRASVGASDGDIDVLERESSEVTVANSEPKIVSAPAVLSKEGRLDYELEVKDPDGDRRFRYALTKGPPGMQLDGVLGTVTWQASTEHVGSHAVEISVKDIYGGEGRQQFELTVSKAPPASPPASPAESSDDSR